MPTKSTKRQRSKKPYRDFPLTHHAGSGQWCKKIRGKIYYFGVEPKKALEKYLDEKDDLQAGRVRRSDQDPVTTLKEVVNRFLTYKKSLLDSEELSNRTFDEYFRSAESILSFFGAERDVNDVRPEDFTSYRAKLSEGRGLHALGKEVRITRMVFHFAQEEGLTDKVIRFGKSFKQPSKKSMRLDRQSKQIRNGKRLFAAKEIRAILASASVNLKAMTLLAINCGFGQSDCATLPVSAIDLERSWLEFPRPKTGIVRQSPLWSETIAAIRDSLERRQEPSDDANSGLVFLTRQGNPWVRSVNKGTPEKPRIVTFDRVANEFAKVLAKLNLKRPGLNFYALRHTFETVAGESKDQVAVDYIMGHADNSMASLYREEISKERLVSVVQHVRQWLWEDADHDSEASELRFNDK